MEFKVICPTGYQIVDEINDNLDINVILENGEIFFCTLFTIENIKTLIENSTFFWADNMVIVQDLKKTTIKKLVIESLDFENFRSIFTKIGYLEKSPGYNYSFESIIEFSNGREGNLSDW